MGAYRAQALSLSPWMYFTFDTYTWEPPTEPLTMSTVGEIQAAYISLKRRPTMVRTETGDTHAGGFNIIDNGGEQVSKGAQYTYVMTVSAETGDSSAPINNSSRGFLYVHVGGGVSGPQPWWDLHETAAGTIGIATYGYWSDEPAQVYSPDPPYGLVTVWGRYDNDLNAGTTGSQRLYVYDTGIPAVDLLDGRPHLLAVSTQGADQPYSTSGPVATSTSIKISIDGTPRYTSARGPAWSTSVGGSSEFVLHATGVDELGIWRRLLSDAEISSLWGPAVWGDLSSWPHLGSSTTASYATISTPDPILRILGDPELTHVQASTSTPDPVWIEEATAGSADASGVTTRADMGSGTWEGNDPWSSTRDRGLAAKWLDMDEDVALLAVPLVGTAYAYADLGLVLDQPAGGTLGRSSVSGDLVVALPLQVSLIQGSSTVYAITIGNLDVLAAASAGASAVSASLIQGQTEHLAAASAGGSTAQGDLSVTTYSLIEGEEVDGDGMPMGGGGRRRSHFAPLSVGYVSERAQGVATAGAGVGIDGVGLGS